MNSFQKIWTKHAAKDDWVQPTTTTFTKKPKPQFGIDWSFIASLEGFETKGYIPKEENESRNLVKSGVTIASGFDLGQHDIKYLNKLNLPEDLKRKLIPYMGLTGQLARDMLKVLPLYVTKEEALLINKEVKHDKAVEVMHRYNEASKKHSFTSLDSPVQTVIMSVAFQYGDLGRRTPNFWGVVTKGDWKGMLWHLEHFGDRYKTRRLKEAKVIRSYLKQKGIYYA